MNKKVFVFDVDGTLLNKKEKIQPSHIKALLKTKEKGHEIVLCSGRGFDDMIPVLEQLPKDLVRFLVCNNGTYIHDLYDSKNIIDSYIDFSILKKFEEIGRKHVVLFSIHTLDVTKRGHLWAKENEPEWYQKVLHGEWHKFQHVPFSDAKNYVTHNKITQLSYRATKKIIKKIRKDCRIFEDKYSVFVSGEVYVDILPKNKSKLNGLINLSKILNIPITNFISFGDSGNDIEMLNGSGIGIAVGNATKEAKQAADIIIGDHNTSALADKLLELI